MRTYTYTLFDVLAAAAVLLWLLLYGGTPGGEGGEHLTNALTRCVNTGQGIPHEMAKES